MSCSIVRWVVVLATLGFPDLSPGADEPKAKTPPGLVTLEGEDAKRAETLRPRIEALGDSGRFTEAAKQASDLETLLEHVLGKQHHETVTARCRRTTLERIASRSKAEQDEYLKANRWTKQAIQLDEAGRFKDAHPLYIQVLEIDRRLLGDDHLDTASALNNLAFNLHEQGKPVESTNLVREALGLFRRLLGEDHPETADTYGNLALSLDRQGKSAEAQQYAEKSLEIKRRLFGDDHKETAAAYGTLATIVTNQSLYAKAQPLFEKSLDIMRRSLGEDHQETAQAYNNLALNLKEQAKYAEAQPFAEKALDILRRLHGEAHPFTAIAYNNLADYLVAQGKYREAQPLLIKSLDIKRRTLTENHPSTATAFNALAMNLRSQGRYAEALPLFLKSLEIYRRLLTDDHPNTATAFGNLAETLRLQGKALEAQAPAERCLEIRRRLLTDDHVDTALAYNSLAVVLSEQANHVEASRLYAKSLGIRQRMLGEDHPTTAIAYANLGSALSDLGQLREAQAVYLKSIEIHKKRLGEDHPAIALDYLNLATTHRALGEYEQSRKLSRHSYDIHRRVYGLDHPNTILAINNLAEDLDALGHPAEAETLLVKGIEGFENARVNTAFEGLERTALTSRLSPFLPLAVLEARLKRPEQAFEYLERNNGRGLLDELEARRDTRLDPADRRQLENLLHERQRLDSLFEPRDDEPATASLTPPKEKELLAKRAALMIELGELQTRLRREHGAFVSTIASLKRIQQTLSAEDALIAWLDLTVEGPRNNRPELHWAVVLRSQGSPHWVNLPGTGPNGTWTATDRELPNRVQKLLSEPPTASNRAGFAEILSRFRKQWLDPLEAHLDAIDELPPARRLIVLNSPALSLVPLDAVLDAKDPRSVSYVPSGTILAYLKDRPATQARDGVLAMGDPVFTTEATAKEPSTLPMGGLLIRTVLPGSGAQRAGLRAGDVLLSYNGSELTRREDLKPVAEPAPGEKSQPIQIRAWRDGFASDRSIEPGRLGVVLDPQPAPVALRDDRRLQKTLLVARSGGETFADLPGTRFEVQAIARLAKAVDLPVSAFFDEEASEQTIDRLTSSRQLKGFRFLHFATHGVIDLDRPQRTAVILSQVQLPDPMDQVLQGKAVIDGKLSVREIQQKWELDAELVTLSACETAVGKSSGGEGLLGFTQALLTSGARAVCLSLWKVDDTATALMMERFYENLLKRKMSRGLALSEAKRWLRQLSLEQATTLAGQINQGISRGKGRPLLPLVVSASSPTTPNTPPVSNPSTAKVVASDRPFADQFFWAAFILVGDPN